MPVDYTHEITVDRAFGDAIHLFTPKGEEAWVPGWKPSYIFPTSGETREEMIFTTGENDEATFWTCLKWQPDAGHARYFRLTPQSRAVIVDVQCRPENPHRTRVRVTYRMHALTDAGRTFLSGMTQSSFAGMIDEWAGLIGALES